MSKIDTEKLKNNKITKGGSGLVKEFMAFISKGNVIDLAVGVIIGGAFGTIVSSLVDDIIMPLVGMLIGGVNFSTLTVKVGEARLAYGMFIQNVIDFLIVAACIFLFIKVINQFKRKKEEEPAEPPKKDEQIVLLEEIRDLLKK